MFSIALSLGRLALTSAVTAGAVYGAIRVVHLAFDTAERRIRQANG